MIYIDSHEPEFIKSGLRYFNIPLEIKDLPIGDYLIGNICIERKTWSDFIQSVYDKRLFKQAIDMSNNYDKNLFLVHDRKYVMSKLDSRTFRSALATLLVKFNISVLEITDNREIVPLLVDIYKSTIRTNKTLMPTIKYKKDRSLSEIREDVLCAIPGIGRSTAINMLSKMGSIANVINNLEEVLKKKCIGEKRYHYIKNIIWGSYE